MHHPQLFALHIWTAQTDPETSEIQFKVQHVFSGEARNARHWADVEAFVMQILQDAEIGVWPKKENPR